MNDKLTKSKFIYRSVPIFRQSDETSVKAWEARTFDTIRCERLDRILICIDFFF
jgi:hypothetical protein